MANTFQSITTGLAELKNFYQGPLVDQFNEDVNIYRGAEKGDVGCGPLHHRARLVGAPRRPPSLSRRVIWGVCCPPGRGEKLFAAAAAGHDGQSGLRGSLARGLSLSYTLEEISSPRGGCVFPRRRPLMTGPVPV